MSKEEWFDAYDIMYEHFKEMQEKSADYSAGYRAGWNDCYKMFKDLIGKNEDKKPNPNKQFYDEYKKLVEEVSKKTQNTYTYPYIPNYTQPWNNVIRNCPQCGIQLTDTMGRPIPLGYVCNSQNCPTFPKVSYTYGTGGVWANNTGSVSYTSNTIWINPRS